MNHGDKYLMLLARQPSFGKGWIGGKVDAGV